ncbi:MAG: DUF6290 family protein [Caldilineaceae bacterium]|nr:DUF6290 family protein [Caldilineaceae bacterium]
MSTQITVRLPDEQTVALDEAATVLDCSRAEVVRQAIEQYLEDFDDLSVAIERLRDPSDQVLDWDEVRRELLRSDKKSAAMELARLPGDVKNASLRPLTNPSRSH